MYRYEGCTIRNVEESDLEFIQEIRNDPETWVYLSYVGMLNMRNQKKWFEKISDNDSTDYFIIENSGQEKIGYVRMDEIDKINRSIRVGLDIHKNYRGQGYGKKTMKAVLKYCFDYINMNRVWLLVLDSNSRAKHIYESCGFKVEGTMRQAIYREGKYHDYVMMSILREEYKI